MGKGETRRDFITLAGLSLLSLAYSGCSTAEGRDPFIFTPERAGVNCGFALGDLRGLAKANFFVAGDEEQVCKRRQGRVDDDGVSVGV